jgi:hypothetical protein
MVVAANGQTLVNRWYGKNGERLLIAKDTSAAEFKAFDLSVNSYEFKTLADSIFSLGYITWKTTSIKTLNGEDRQKTEKLIEWYPFKILKLSADTLIIEYASSKRIGTGYFDKLILFSYQRLQEIKNPMFISLEYDRGGFHAFIDSTGVVKYWFDESNAAQIAPGKTIQGVLTDIQLGQLKNWFGEDELQNLPKDYGRASDGVWTSLKIKAIPRDIVSYGSGPGDPETVLFKLFKFLNNINVELSGGK